ncbi:FAD:protein FMN transferase [Rudaeicoccus suwonensis]|uniref:FAD:protein FMN transferase n=1 Tax=Rudaeicoccus suwonensis TaxID=657409 RepID=A0A561E0X8_9MICO|nr:FAD:protein FMN transferase [Rudaeicoccus suwonensis]TWE09259.1 thiamine biosynthesis lipoprotein [Rudaeicoccus suwonensis]
MITSEGFHSIGVMWRITASQDDSLAAACEVAHARLEELDAAASRFRHDSEVTRLAAMAAPAGRTTITAPVSPLLLTLLRDALWAAEATGGLVDPTLGQAMALAGYDTDLAVVQARDTQTPPATAVAHRAPQIPTSPSSLHDLVIDPMAGTVTIAAGTVLDLGATAKAAMADRIAGELAARWPGGFLVDLGGDIAVAGPPPAGGWVISTPETADGEDRLCITTQGVATSGTDRRRWLVDSEERHHLLDPRTGRAIRHTWRQVTCVGASALQANAASTAACVLSEAAVEWLSSRGIPARLVADDGTVTYTPRWPRTADQAAS